MERNKIYQKDCVVGMKEMGENSVDVIVTSPPYNIDKPYNSYDDKKPRDEYLGWLEDVGRCCKRVMKEDGSFFLNVGGKPSDQWIPLEIARNLKDHFILQNTIHWIKSIAISKEDVGDHSGLEDDMAIGHYQPVNSERYLSGCHEYIFHFVKESIHPLNKLAIGVKYQDKSNIARWKSNDKDLRERGNTWFIPYPTIQRSRPHPTVFPVKLPKMCIKLHGLENTDLVLDPFMGIGTTAVACRELGVDYIGFEIDEKYIEESKRRLG